MLVSLLFFLFAIGFYHYYGFIRLHYINITRMHYIRLFYIIKSLLFVQYCHYCSAYIFIFHLPLFLFSPFKFQMILSQVCCCIMFVLLCFIIVIIIFYTRSLEQKLQAKNQLRHSFFPSKLIWKHVLIFIFLHVLSCILLIL